MDKKKFPKKNFKNSDELSEQNNSNDILHKIRKKLDDSAALNGGFDKLIFMIDSIEKNQIQIVEKVDKIHEAIYNPDDGLFARIAINKVSQLEAVTTIEKRLIEISTWQEQCTVDSISSEKKEDEINSKIQKIEYSISNIQNFQNTLFSSFKWLCAAASGGILAAFIKFLFNSIKSMP